MSRILEYDTVRVVALHGSPESHLAFSEAARPPAVGDVGTVVDLTEPGSAMFLSVQPGVPELVARLRQQWLATASPQDRHRPYVERQNVLPLASDMDGFYAVSTSGAFLEFQWDAEERGRLVTDERAVHSTWFQAAKKYPEFAVFLPDRPPSAQVCAICAGSGTPANLPEHLADAIVCYCGGAGWLPPAMEQAPRFAVHEKNVGGSFGADSRTAAYFGVKLSDG